jgi:hypothetical protein
MTLPFAAGSDLLQRFPSISSISAAYDIIHRLCLAVERDQRHAGPALPEGTTGAVALAQQQSIRDTAQRAESVDIGVQEGTCGSRPILQMLAIPYGST